MSTTPPVDWFAQNAPKSAPSGSSGDWFAATSPATVSQGPDDPNGTYDFGALGKVQGMRTNGRPATRQEAFKQLSYQRGFAQTMGETFQQKRQDVSKFIQSSTDTDQATKEYLGDLAGMLVTGGAPGGARALRWSESASEIGNALRSVTPTNPLRKLVAKVLNLGPEALEEQTSPTALRNLAEQKHLPISGPAPAPVQQTAPILTPLDAALARERATAARPDIRRGANAAAEFEGPEAVTQEDIERGQRRYNAERHNAGAKAAADFEGAAATTPEERRAQGEAFERERQHRFDVRAGSRAAGEFEGAEPMTLADIARLKPAGDLARFDALKAAAQPTPFEAPTGTLKDMNPYYGKTRQVGMPTPHELLAPHQRQLESPTFSTAPGQPQQLKAGQSTIDAFRKPDGSWTDERQKLHDNIIANALQGHQPPAGRAPEIWILGGGTASGKTTASRAILAQDPNIVRLDPDELKLSIPEYAGLKQSDPTKAAVRVHDESSYLNKRALASAVAKGLDIAYDTTTSGDLETKQNLVNYLKGAGYKVKLLFSDVPVETAIQRSDLRARESLDPLNKDRFVPHDMIRKIHSEVSRNFEGMKDSADAAYLLDNSRPPEIGPELIYSKEGNNPSTVHNPELYERFQKKGAGNAGQQKAAASGGR